jgi:hypothetical protein
MLQKPHLCGGMSHVLEFWNDNAKTYLDEIVFSVDSATTDVFISRAGYFLEERRGLAHPGIAQWKVLGQRGGWRKFDPDKPFAPEFSEVWMLSLNV